MGLDKKGAGEELTMIFLKRLGEAIAVRRKRTEILESLAGLCGRG